MSYSNSLNEFPFFLLLNYILNPAIFPYSVKCTLLKTKQKEGSSKGSSKKNIQFLLFEDIRMPINSIFSSFLSKLLKLKNEYKLINLPSYIIKGLSVSKLILNNEVSSPATRANDLGLDLGISQIYTDIKWWLKI